MAYMNLVVLIGNLTRDPELYYTANGTPHVKFGLAINRYYTESRGDKKKRTCFIEVMVWGKQAESSSKHLSKGALVGIHGRLEYFAHDNPGNDKQSCVYVVAESVQFLKTKHSGISIKAETDTLTMDRVPIESKEALF